MSGNDSDSSTETVVSSEDREKSMAKQFIGNIEHFTPGDDFSNYIERVDELLKLNGVKEDAEISFLVGICGADLYKIMKYESYQLSLG